METVFILLMAVGLSHGIQTSCDARQDGAQCYAAVDGTVDLRLVEEIETEREYRWLKEAKEKVFEFRRNTFKAEVKYKHRSSFDVSSGTFKMSDITSSDEAHYVLTISDKSTGQAIKHLTKRLHLSVQAPVSRPQLSSECLSQGQMRVSCSCEGDSVQYSWTLDGEPLTDQQLVSGHHDTQSITLPVGSSGLLICDVYNNVSRAAADQDISACGGFKFINCTLTNGTLTGWVFDNDTSCPTLTTTPTTTPTPTTTTTTTKKTTTMAYGRETSSFSPSSSSTHIIPSSSNQTSSSSSAPPTTSWFFKFLPLIAGSLTALLLLLLVGVGIYCKKKQKSTDVSKRAAADQDVTYADVRVLQKQNAGVVGEEDVTYADPQFQKRSRRDVRRAEREVEYGQVRMTDVKKKKTAAAGDSVEYGEVRVSGGARPAQSAAGPSAEDECVYSKVRVKQ